MKMKNDEGSGMRQSGKTTAQMQEAPQGAVFIWCNSVTGYPKSLAVKIGRTDLDIVSPDWLTGYKYVGRTITGLVIDHAFWEHRLKSNDQEMYSYHIDRARTRIK